MSTEALKKQGLLANSNYEVIISLDDNSGEDKQVRRFTLSTPKYIQKLSYYLPESSISKSFKTDTKYNTAIEYPEYTSSTTYNFVLDNIEIDMGTPTHPAFSPSPRYYPTPTYKIPPNPQEFKSPKEAKCTITLTFKGDGDIDKSLYGSLQGVLDPFYNLLTDTSGVTVKGKTIKISRWWNDIDPTILFGDSWRQAKSGQNQGKYGFWDSSTYRILRSISDSDDVKKNEYWKKLKNIYIQYTTDTFHKGKTVDPKDEITYSLDTTLNTKIPAAVITNTIDDYDNGVVDYFYFFVRQQGTKNWWYFDNNLSTINPAANGGKITGKKGWIRITGNRVYHKDTNTVAKEKKPVQKVTDPTTQIAISSLQNRSATASAYVFSGSKTLLEGKKFSDNNFPNLPLEIKFAVVRYVRDDSGNWTGKWMPNLLSTYGIQEASEILSGTEIIGGN